MNRRLRLAPPKHRLAQISGSRIMPIRSPPGEKTCTPSYPAPAQPAPTQMLPSISARIPSAKPPVLPGIAMLVNRSEEHTSELQSPRPHVCRLLLEKKNNLQLLRNWLYFKHMNQHLTNPVPE